jgi:hypothetical protein
MKSSIMRWMGYGNDSLHLRVSDAEAKCFRPPNKHSLCNSSRIRLCVSRRVADPALGVYTPSSGGCSSHHGSPLTANRDGVDHTCPKMFDTSRPFFAAVALMV